MPRFTGNILIYNANRAGNPSACIWPSPHGAPTHLQAYTQYYAVDDNSVAPFYVREAIEVRGLVDRVDTLDPVVQDPGWRSVSMQMGKVQETQHPENPALRVAPRKLDEVEALNPYVSTRRYTVTYWPDMEGPR